MGVLDVLRDLLGPLTDVLHPGGGSSCAIPWQPHALAPVFWGFHAVGPPVVAPSFSAADAEGTGRADPDSTAARGTPLRDLGDLHTGVFAPTNMHILFPTLDGSPQNAQILHRCGGFPLVVLAHGQCQSAQAAHFVAWARSPLAMQLARAGYVVVVPQLSGGSASDREVALVLSVMRWVRTGWVHGGLLTPSTVLIGHSRGSVLAGLVAAEVDATAYVSLSGDWHGSFGDPTETQRAIGAPMLFVKGAREGDVDLGRFGDLPFPRYRAVLTGAEHYDYLMPGSSPCAADRGACAQIPSVIADLVTMFLGRFAPAEGAEALAAQVPDSLVRQLGDLTLQQEFYAGAYLTGFRALSGKGCGLHLRFQVAADQAEGQLTVGTAP
jgi:hypothetical protein